MKGHDKVITLLKAPQRVLDWHSSMQRCAEGDAKTDADERADRLLAAVGMDMTKQFAEHSSKLHEDMQAQRAEIEALKKAIEQGPRQMEVAMGAMHATLQRHLREQLSVSGAKFAEVVEPQLAFVDGYAKRQRQLKASMRRVLREFAGVCEHKEFEADAHAAMAGDVEQMRACALDARWTDQLQEFVQQKSCPWPFGFDEDVPLFLRSFAQSMDGTVARIDARLRLVSDDTTRILDKVDAIHALLDDSLRSGRALEETKAIELLFAAQRREAAEMTGVYVALDCMSDAERRVAPAAQCVLEWIHSRDPAKPSVFNLTGATGTGRTTVLNKVFCDWHLQESKSKHTAR